MLAFRSLTLMRISSRYPWLPLLLTVFFGISCFSPMTLAAETTAPSFDQLNNESLEQQYKSANSYFSQLERDSALGKDRGNWLNGVKNFRKIHLAQKKGLLGPSSLYMMAKMHRRMYEQFKIPIDLDNAIDQFIEVATLYPGHSLADAALFAAAESSLLGKGKEQQAAEWYRKIVEVYPKGDYYEKALARMKEQKEKRQGPTVEAHLNPTVAKDLVHILPVKYWSSTGYTRIVIQTSSPISYTSSLLEKDGDQPRRLYVDLAQSAIPPKSSHPIPVQDSLLKQIRPSQLSSNTVRVALDIESLSEYKIFTLNDPFRVVVDVHGALPTRITEQPLQETTFSQQQTKEPLKESPPILQQNNEKPVISLEDQKKRSPKQGIQKKPLSNEKISLAQQLGLGVRKIVIDPGHGGKDPGAMAFDLKEKDIVLKVSKKIEKILKKSYRYEVALTRTKDVYIPLEERTALANTQNGDLFISIHVNAHPDKTKGGIETYFLNLATNADAMRVAALENATSTHNISELQHILTNLMKNSKIDESSRLAQFVQTNLMLGVEQKYKTHDLGVKQAPFYVLIGAEMPAILAEISFITNPNEAKLLQDELFLNKIAEQIAAGIAAYVDHHRTAAVKF
jgi:N-acetylmuramoyl-L-alanine amidase